MFRNIRRAGDTSLSIISILDKFAPRLAPSRHVLPIFAEIATVNTARLRLSIAVRVTAWRYLTAFVITES